MSLSEKQKMLTGQLYHAGCPELQAEQIANKHWMHRYNNSVELLNDARNGLLAEHFGHVGEGTVIRPPFYCDYGFQTHVGAGTFANFGLVALDVARITIGNDVQIGPRVQLLTATHPLDAERRRAKWESAAPITIEDNVWLGGGVIVCPGVTIGANTVVGAGAVVTRDLPPDVLAMGTPARVVRELR